MLQHLYLQYLFLPMIQRHPLTVLAKY
jgi:hypothetical protein